MKKYEKVKIAIIGAGSVSFAPCTINDILMSETLAELPVEISLMDIRGEALVLAKKYAEDSAAHLKRSVTITTTTSLEESLQYADFVITAIEVGRQYYWSQDWHIFRKYGFKQVFGENGGPASIFHTLRNIPPLLHIAKTMEKVCPDAWLLNFTNPEAKLVEALLKLTTVKVVGLCHGTNMGIEQLADFLQMDEDDIQVEACGLNHFGWFQSIKHRKTGEDLYPKLKANDRRMNWLHDWDDLALQRIMLRTYGLFPYPGTGHCGEYISWAQEFAPHALQMYFYDPARETPWARGVAPHSSFNWSESGMKPPRYPDEGKTFEEMDFNPIFQFHPDHIEPSGEVTLDIIEAIVTNEKVDVVSVNMMNKGLIPNLPEDMVIEISSYADGEGIHGYPMQPLPEAVAAMIRTHGSIHELIIQAYTEQSRDKLLQAVLLDPTCSNYYNAVCAINEMCELQKEILPPLHWA